MYPVADPPTPRPGVEGRLERTIDDAPLTRHVGGEGVFAAPALRGLMGMTRHRYVPAAIPAGTTTLGAEVHVTRSDVGKGHPAYYQDFAARLAAEMPGAFFADQFNNPANPAAHERTTGPEIWAQMDGALDVIVVGVGSGGALGAAAARVPSSAPDEAEADDDLLLAEKPLGAGEGLVRDLVPGGEVSDEIIYDCFLRRHIFGTPVLLQVSHDIR